MKLKIVLVDFEIPPRVKRWGLGIGIPVIVLGVAAAAFAATPLHAWATNDTLQATDLNGNFANLQAQITTGRFVGTINGKQYSVGATKYVGATSTGGPNANG